MTSAPQSASARTANVIGAGPNGLSAAIVLAQAGLAVQVFEAESTPGGAARTLELTLPGFHHDFGSAVHPMAAGSPFFTSLPLAQHGLAWIHSPAPLAHPFDDGTAVVLEQDLSEAVRSFGPDGAAWRAMMQPLVENWPSFARQIFRPVLQLPRHPFLMARFGLQAVQSATHVARAHFQHARTQALFAGIAAHSFLSLDQPLSASFAMVLGAAAHAVGWPIPRGGAQSITDALCSVLTQLGGRIHTSTRIDHLQQLPPAHRTLFDLTPRQVLHIAGDRFSARYRQRLEDFRYGSGAFKVDYALSSPIPWKAAECRRAATVHVGGAMEEIAASEEAVSRGYQAEKPFLLVSQPTLFDPTRAPSGRHIAWTYCHVPNGSNLSMLDRMERQLERFAPGFRDCILERRVSAPQNLEAMDANLVGGDIIGGALDLEQFLLRPTWRQYATSAPDIFFCSASTPPGGGVHGMCGYNAAKATLRGLK